MSQLVACCSPEGLLLAADRRVAVRQGEETRYHSLRKLFPLGPAAALATSGAAVGIAVSRGLSRLLARRGALLFSDLEAYTLHVFQREYDEFVRQGATWFAAHPDARRLSYVLLGGRDRRAGQDEFLFRFYASEAHGEPYRRLPTGAVLTAPRRLGLEARLARAAARGASLDDLYPLLEEGLQRIAEHEDAVSAPFDVAVMGRAGVRFEALEG